MQNLKNSYFVLGNHDYYVLNNIPDVANDRVKEGIKYAKGVISNENLEWLKSLDIQKRIKIGDMTFLMQHGSPENPLNEYIYEDNPKLFNFFSMGYDFVLLGHTHRAYLHKNSNRYIINPGSIGQARDIKNTISFAIYDFENNNAELKRIYKIKDYYEK